jgi:hypothetical protein
MLLKRKKVKEERSISPIALIKIAEYFNHKLHKCSDYLQSKTERLSIHAKRVYLFIFCLLFGSISICVFIKAFTAKQTLLTIHVIAVPAYADKLHSDLLPEQVIITEKEFLHIEAFRRYMDSLRISKTGKFLYDSMMQARPHLMDSILLLENMYQIQSSKK